MTTAPAARATRAAAIAVAIGISNCSSTTSLSAMTARMSAEFTLRCALAPGATTIVFSAAASTTMTAEPLGPGRLTTPSSPTSLARRWARSCSAAASLPSAATSCTDGACPGGGHRLVAALAARRRRERRSENGLTGPRAAHRL